MSVTLACAWQPRGELSRLQRFWPTLRDIYNNVAVAIRRQCDPQAAAWLRDNGVAVVEYDDWSGRHLVMQEAVGLQSDHIQYCDMDRVIRWVETHPEELYEVVRQLQTVDCTIIGRTDAAYLTHPRALYETEKLPNAFFSYWFGRPMDLCAGSKGFSLAAAGFVLANSIDNDALRMDVEWAVLLKRAGFSWSYIEVNGLDWESADQFQDKASDRVRQRENAEAYDQNVNSWSLRVRVAQKIMDSGLEAISRPLSVTGSTANPNR